MKTEKYLRKKWKLMGENIKLQQKYNKLKICAIKLDTGNKILTVKWYFDLNKLILKLQKKNNLMLLGIITAIVFGVIARR